jgi:hypothetical protein
MWCGVGLVRSDVSEELVISMLKVDKIRMLGTVLAKITCS